MQKKTKEVIQASAWMNIAENKALRMEGTKTLIEEVDGRPLIKYYLQNPGKDFLVFKCSRFSRTMLEGAGHTCHARIRISNDLKQYQVYKSTLFTSH